MARAGTKKGARGKRPAPLSVTSTVRLDDETLARVDALREALTTEWRKPTRAEVLRTLIATGLKAEWRRARRRARKGAS